MPFIPHTADETAAMLAAIGAQRLEDLFDEIPTGLPRADLADIPSALGEWQASRLLQQRAAANQPLLSFLGAGAYAHHIPAAVWQLATRGEYYSAYTPYQAEASQGTLQLLYEYQTMIASLTGMEAANASLYDGATALAEALLMAVRLKGIKRVLLPASIHPRYRAVVHAMLAQQAITTVELPFDPATGQLAAAAAEALQQPFAGLVLAWPNFFGVLEDVDYWTDAAHAANGLVIGLANPVALGLLRPPGAWGHAGADIVAGEGQPLGIPLSGGGPYFGFLTTRVALVRQMPGRIVGRTIDRDGRSGFTLTLQAREQHIRRAKATSNICTNQGLMVTAATIHMSILGPEGLRRVAGACYGQTRKLVSRLTQIAGVTPLFTAPHFHEVVVRLPQPVEPVLTALRERGILGGYALAADYPALGNSLLVCATELHQDDDIERFAHELQRLL